MQTAFGDVSLRYRGKGWKRRRLLTCDDLPDDSARPEILVLDDLGDGFADDDDAFAEDDECKKRHALNHVRALERDNSPRARHRDRENRLTDSDDVPRNIRLALRRHREAINVKHLFRKHGRQRSVKNSSKQRPRHDHSKRQNGLLVLFGEQQSNAVLAEQSETGHHEHETERFVYLVVGDVLAGFPLGTDNSESDHDTEVDEFSYTLEDRVGTEAHIVQRDLVPCQPEEGEEANVRS